MESMVEIVRSSGVIMRTSGGGDSWNCGVRDAGRKPQSENYAITGYVGMQQGYRCFRNLVFLWHWRWISGKMITYQYSICLSNWPPTACTGTCALTVQHQQCEPSIMIPVHNKATKAISMQGFVHDDPTHRWWYCSCSWIRENQVLQ